MVEANVVVNVFEGLATDNDTTTGLATEVDNIGDTVTDVIKDLDITDDTDANIFGRLVETVGVICAHEVFDTKTVDVKGAHKVSDTESVDVIGKHEFAETEI